MTSTLINKLGVASALAALALALLPVNDAFAAGRGRGGGRWRWQLFQVGPGSQREHVAGPR